MLLSEEIHFLSKGFPFLSMSKISRTRIRLSHEMSTQLFFFLFLFSGNFCSVGACVVYIVSGRCYQSFCALFMLFSRHCIDASTLSSVLATSLPLPFLDTYSLLRSFLGYEALCIIIINNFPILWFLYFSSLVHFKNGPEYLTMETA